VLLVVDRENNVYMTNYECLEREFFNQQLNSSHFVCPILIKNFNPWLSGSKPCQSYAGIQVLPTYQSCRSKIGQGIS